MSNTWLLVFFVFLFNTLQSFTISPRDSGVIAEKIWKNECGGNIENLTHWNRGEDFGSFGIGHFIWYPERIRGSFEETFPALLLFLEKEGSILPSWLKKCKECPWRSFEEFHEKKESVEMLSLRQFLLETKSLQMAFMVNRLQQTLEKALLDFSDQSRVLKNFAELAKDSKGLYALIDYCNFKGSGLSPAESYNGHRWGLLQVLQNMPATSENILVSFVKEAKEVLSQRVKNAPPERNEGKWLLGWHNRIDTYLRDE